MTRVVHFSTKSYHKYLKLKKYQLQIIHWTKLNKVKDRIQIESEINSISSSSSSCIGLFSLPSAMLCNPYFEVLALRYKKCCETSPDIKKV